MSVFKNNKKAVLAVLCCLLCGSYSAAQTSLDKPDLGKPTLIAPAYFGPNAFAVPDIADGTVTGELRAELAADGHFGFAGDRTADLFARVHIPLFTDRVNLVLWMPVCEWYKNSLLRQQQCRLQDTVQMSGREYGDVYVSTDILILKERKRVPSLVLRACLRTASGGSYPEARFYDGPGYFFDVALGKGFEWSDGWTARVAGSAGFLCWQTDNGRQNDAVMYGLQGSLGYKYIRLKAFWSGYTGWERVGDRPMIVRAALQGTVPLRADAGYLEPFVEYQYGIRDQPWHSLRVGMAYRLDVIGRAAKRQANKTK